MYFNNIRLTGLTSFVFPIQTVTLTDPYIVKAIDGLGPPEVDVAIVNTLYGGGIYQGRRPQNREIVMRVGLNPNWSTGQTAAQLREALYDLFTPSSTRMVLFELRNNTTVVAETQSQLKRIEIVPFSKDPEVQLTLSCPAAYFNAPGGTSVNTTGLSKSAPVINNTGTAQTGFEWRVTLTANASFWLLSHQETTNSFQVNYAFLSGDQIIFRTTPGDRAFIRTRAGVALPLLSYIVAGSTWHQLDRGNNTFATGSSNFNWTSINYTPRYWGI